MRRLLLLIALPVLLMVAACQPDPSLVQDGPRLIGERTLAPNENAIPTLFVLPTSTPVVVPTSAPTEVAAVPIATAEDTGFTLVTPTLLPSKTPTSTPTQTLIPTSTSTPTTTVTATASPTSSQFDFSGSGQASAAEATAFAQGVIAASNNPNAAPPLPQAQFRAPAANCTESPWFFTQYAPPTCPIEQPTTGAGVFQRFETGYMVWLEANDRIYVMYNTAEQPRWQVFSDPYEEGAPELDYAWHTYEEQPPQTWQPRRGFGEVWRQFDDVRFRIGWAVQQWETIYTPRFQRGDDGSISIEDPLGGVFYLAPRGTDWQLFRGR